MEMKYYFSDSYVESMKEKFCNQGRLGKEVEQLVANKIFGPEQLDLIARRYDDMRKNFDRYTQDYAEKYAKTENERWQFSEGLHPFDPGRGWGYTDTTAVVMPVTHPDFKEIFDGINNSIGVDLPTWFNIKDDNRGRIMLIAQDPLRSSKWYAELKDKVIVSSPFGLQDRVHRNNFKGGRRFHILVSSLVDAEYGVYLTDCRKFFVKDHSTSDSFYQNEKNYKKNIEILRSEIELVNPTKIVAFGNYAYDTCCKMLPDEYKDRLMEKIPHLSGRAHKYVVGYINRHYHLDPSKKYGVDESGKAVADIIIEGMRADSSSLFGNK